jgi:hypothetical protein
MPSHADVASWMLQEILDKGMLYQHVAAHEIRSLFGEEFTYINGNGNSALAKPVLSAFRKVTDDRVIWERGERRWRLRASHDGPGRQQS